MKKQLCFRILISFVINIAIACIAIFVFGTRIYLNDDSSISWLAYGISTEATSRTYYTHFILGWVYKHLFLKYPGFEWQTLIHYLGMVFSGTVGLYVVLKKRSSLLTYFWFLFEVAFFYDVYVCLTFSVVAAYIACQGYLALFLAVKHKGNSPILYIMIGGVVLLSSMIRAESFIAISGYAFAVWVVFVALEIKGKIAVQDIVKTYIYPFVAIVGVSLLFIGIDKLAYTSEDWKYCKEYEANIKVFTDGRNSLEKMELEELEQYGFSESMRDAVLEWRNNDPEKIKVEGLEPLANRSIKENNLSNPMVWKDFFLELKTICTNFFETYFSILVFLFMMFGIRVKGSHLKNRIPTLLLLPLFGEVFYFALIGRGDGGQILERCVHIELMGLSMGSIILCDLISREEKTKTIVSRIFLLLVAIASVVSIKTKDLSVNGLGLVDVGELEKKYRFLGNSDKVYVCDVWLSSEIDESFGAWQVPPEGFLDHCLALGGWTVNNPALKNKQKELECDNPYRALFEKDNVYLVRKEAIEGEVLKYLRENYDERISYEYIKTKNGYKVFKYYIE